MLQAVTSLHLVGAYDKVRLAACLLLHTAGPVGGHAPEVTLLFQCCNHFLHLKHFCQQNPVYENCTFTPVVPEHC